MRCWMIRCSSRRSCRSSTRGSGGRRRRKQLPDSPGPTGARSCDRGQGLHGVEEFALGGRLTDDGTGKVVWATVRPVPDRTMTSGVPAVLASKPLGDGVGRGAVQLFGDALVGVAGQGGGGVTELLGDDLDVDAGVQGDAGLWGSRMGSAS